MTQSAAMRFNVVSLSGGKDSTATALVCRELEDPASCRYVFADTGNEHPITIEYVRDYLPSALGVKIDILRQDFTEWWWHRRNYIAEHWPLPHKDWPNGVPQAIVDRALQVFDKGPTGNPYLDLCIIKGRFPSRRAQFCTQFLKTEPLSMGRVGCMPCINCGKDELREISKRFPGEIDRIEEWEAIVGLASKRGNSSFFPAPEGGRGDLMGRNVRQVVEWSKTVRGGRVKDIFADMEPASCSSSYGLCE